MGNFNSTIKFCNFENVKSAIKNNIILINTLPDNNQECLIEGTIDIESEVKLLNKLINEKKSIIKENTNYEIIIYGKNGSDYSILKKYNQLNKLGFKNIVIYSGGLFEWLLLQEVYGIENFPTTSLELDILKYK